MVGKFSKYMAQGMDKLFLSCEKATLLLARGEYEALSGFEKGRVKIHLAMCPHCRRFKRQNKVITETVKHLHDQETTPLFHLSADSKKRIQINLDKERVLGEDE